MNRKKRLDFVVALNRTFVPKLLLGGLMLVNIRFQSAANLA